MDPIFGQLMAIFAAFSLAVNSTLMTVTGKRFGSVIAVRGMAGFALICVTVLHCLTFGWPDLSPIAIDRILYLLASGIFGFGAGAVLVTMAFVRIGPRMTALLTALGPIFSSIMAWLVFGEKLHVAEYLGIALTLSGVAFVVTERRDHFAREQDDRDSREYWMGILYAFCAAFIQASVLILNRQGLEGDIEPLTATYIRLLGGIFVLWGVALLQGRLVHTVKTLASAMPELSYLALAGFLGPTFGVFLVLVALETAPVGIVSALSNLKPIILVPIGFFFFHEHISRRAILGTLVAVVGTIMIFFL